MTAARSVGATLFLCLAAAQAAVLVLTPVLPGVAADLDVSTATAGQLRTISGLAAGATAFAAGVVASRIGLRELTGAGLVVLAAGSALSALAGEFAVLAVAQVFIGAGVGLSYTAALAAVAEWTSAAERSRVLAVALLGPPVAWVVAMPLCGVLGDVDWRLAWIVPVLAAGAALAALFRLARTPPASTRADLRAALSHPGVLRWSVGELFAYSAWAGALVFIGALFVESYGLSLTTTGFALGAAVMAAVLGAVRPSVWFSLAAFSVLSFLAGGRTLAGSAHGLDLAPALRLG